jgi:hypothetical protein
MELLVKATTLRSALSSTAESGRNETVCFAATGRDFGRQFRIPGNYR